MAKRVFPGRSSTGQQNEAFVTVKNENTNLPQKNEKTTFSGVVDLEMKTKSAGNDWRNYTTRKRVSNVSGNRNLSKQETAQGDDAGLDMELIDPEETQPTMRPDRSNGSITSSMKVSKAIYALNKKAIEHFVLLNKFPSESAEVNLDLLSSLFAEGAQVNCSDKYGQTMLHEVARTWHIDVAAFLIDNGADVTLSDRYGRTPLHIAAATDYPEMIEFLLQKGANIEAKTATENQTPLHFAARNDAVEACKILVKLGSKTEIHDYKKRTPVHVAAELDRSETARWLVENGANVGVIDIDGQSCMTHMITKMGPVAREALDTFHKTDRTNRRQYYYLNLLEHDIADEDNGYSGKDTELHGTLAKSPLQVIVGFKQLDIIMHPVILKMLELKWNSFGRVGAIKLLLLNIFYIALWTVLAVGVPWQTRYKYTFPGSDVWRVIFWILAMGMTLYYIVIEVMEITTSRRKFKKWKDWRIASINEDIKFTHPKWPEERSYLEREKDTLDDMLSSYFQDFWNFFDWTVYFFNFAVLITHVINIVAYTEENRPAPCCGNDGCDDAAKLIRLGNLTEKGSCALPDAYVNNGSLSVWVNRIFVINIMMMWLRLMKTMRSFRTLGPFVVMLGKITHDVLRFLFLYFEFYIPYACAFWMIFGNEPSIASMSTVDQMLFSLYRITLVDEYEYDQMHTFDVVMAYFLCGTFLGISAILCINLFIALLSDTFQRVYDNANANAVMQQAIQILAIEESLNKKTKDRFVRFIQKKCSPLEEYYDDDLTVSQDDNLKKATLQIRSQMEEVLEHIHGSDRDGDEMMENLHKGISNNNKIQSNRQMKRPMNGKWGGKSGKIGDDKLQAKYINIVKQENEDTMKRMQNDITDIKKALRQLVVSLHKTRKATSDVQIAGVATPPSFPLDISTLPPVRDLHQRRPHNLEGIRHPGLERGISDSRSMQEDLMRRLIHSSQESGRSSRGFGQGDADFEMTTLPGSSGQLTLQPGQVGPALIRVSTAPSPTVVFRETDGQNQADQDKAGSSNA